MFLVLVCVAKEAERTQHEQRNRLDHQQGEHDDHDNGCFPGKHDQRLGDGDMIGSGFSARDDAHDP